jgi:hypothetical protein
MIKRLTFHRVEMKYTGRKRCRLEPVAVAPSHVTEPVITVSEAAADRAEIASQPLAVPTVKVGVSPRHTLNGLVKHIEALRHAKSLAAFSAIDIHPGKVRIESS